MRFNWIGSLAVASALAGALHGQGNQRNATITGGGNRDQGRCTIEVVVDGAAQVEIRGTSATLRNTSGGRPQWRRFECTSAMPNNPVGFGFKGVDGRGSQTLVQDPRNGGVAVVNLQDRDNGQEGYTFDFYWDTRGQQGYNGPANNNAPLARDPRAYDNNGQYRPNYQSSDYYKRYNHGFAKDEAVRVCQNEVLRKAQARFPRAEIHFDRTTTDDKPGRDDWVVGMLDVHRPRETERLRFSCSVNFENGNVRSAELDARPLNGNR